MGPLVYVGTAAFGGRSGAARQLDHPQSLPLAYQHLVILRPAPFADRRTCAIPGELTGACASLWKLCQVRDLCFRSGFLRISVQYRTSSSISTGRLLTYRRSSPSRRGPEIQYSSRVSTSK